MAIVNFSIPAVLEKRVDATIKRKGFASKAEFFRFAAIYYIETLDKPVTIASNRLRTGLKSL
jgi:metal-responsive CopG/Arc/MetJ family transcriptional regulator